MDIDWSGLGEVFGVALGATVVVVVLFSVGITAIARRQQATGEAEGRGSAGPMAAAVLCFLVCVLIVAYGLYLIVRK